MTATVVYGKTCYDNNVGPTGMAEFLLGSTAPPGSGATLTLSSDHGPTPRQANATAGGTGDLLFSFPVYDFDEALYDAVLTVGGAPYALDFGAYYTPLLEASCVEERP